MVDLFYFFLPPLEEKLSNNLSVMEPSGKASSLFLCQTGNSHPSHLCKWVLHASPCSLQCPQNAVISWGMAVWFSNFQAAVSKLLGWPRATFCALLEIFKDTNAVIRSTSGLWIEKGCKSLIQVKKPALCCLEMWNLPPTQQMNSSVAFSQSPDSSLPCS